MNIKVITKSFEEALKKADLVRLTKSKDLPILETVNIQATTDQKVILTASDLEKQIDIIMDDVEVIEAGEIAITNVKNLLKSFKYLKNYSTELKIESDNLIITNEDKELKMKYQQDFPKGLKITNEYAKEYIYNTKALHNRIDKLKGFASQEEIRPILTGICFKGNDMVALDGFKLGLNKDSNLNIESPFVVPVKALEILQKLVNKTDKNISIKVDDRVVEFAYDNISYKSRLLEGEYINYNSILPEEYKTRITLNTKQLKQLKENIEFLNTYITDNKVNVVSWSIENNNIKNTLNTVEGIYKADSKCTVEGDSLEIAFNNKYAMDILKVIEAENVEIELSRSVSPAVIKCNDGNELYLLLPVRMNKAA